MSDHKNILFSTPTSSATEHESKVWCFKGFEILILIGGVLCSAICLVFLNMFSASDSVKIFFGAGPIVLAFIYVIFFLLGKPPHYQDNLFEQHIGDLNLPVLNKYIFGTHLDYQPELARKTNPLYRNSNISEVGIFSALMRKINPFNSGGDQNHENT